MPWHFAVSFLLFSFHSQMQCTAILKAKRSGFYWPSSYFAVEESNSRVISRIYWKDEWNQVIWRKASLLGSVCVCVCVCSCVLDGIFHTFLMRYLATISWLLLHRAPRRASTLWHCFRSFNFISLPSNIHYFLVYFLCFFFSSTVPCLSAARTNILFVCLAVVWGAVSLYI